MIFVPRPAEETPAASGVGQVSKVKGFAMRIGHLSFLFCGYKYITRGRFWQMPEPEARRAEENPPAVRFVHQKFGENSVFSGLFGEFSVRSAEIRVFIRFFRCEFSEFPVCPANTQFSGVNTARSRLTRPEKC